MTKPFALLPLTLPLGFNARSHAAGIEFPGQATCVSPENSGRKSSASRNQTRNRMVEVFLTEFTK
jgi:hypothetical protein